jgi:acetolactate synthase-1/3 small subunit
MIVEVTGSEDKVEAFIDMMRPFSILELVRTGEVAIARSKRK